MCNIWKRENLVKWKPADLETIFSNSLFSENTEVINITGGEPSLHEDFVEIMELAVNNLRSLDTVSLQTNGLDVKRVASAINDVVGILKAVEESGKSIHLDINISLDGPKEIHEKIRGVKGAWENVTETAEESITMIKQLKRGAVSFNFTIVRQNMSYMQEMYDFAKSMGVETAFTFPQETDIYMQNNGKTDGYLIAGDQRQELISLLDDFNSAIKGRSAVSRRYFSILIKLLKGGSRSNPCPLAKSGLFLEPGGNAYPCWNSSKHLLGNIIELGSDEILNRAGRESYTNILHESCRACTSNCYIEWDRRRFARLTAKEKV